jgi:5-methylcytosine-specific restriction enzyme subunit McrC
MASPSLKAGVVQAPGLLFDMNKLFEAHVARLEEANVGPDCIVHTQGPYRYLATEGQTEVFLLRPDITVCHAGQGGAASKVLRLVDAKWKRLDPRTSQFGVDRADIHQMLAYALRYGCDDVELVYPMPFNSEAFGSAPVFKVNASGLSKPINIRVKLVPLGAAAPCGPSEPITPIAEQHLA